MSMPTDRPINDGRTQTAPASAVTRFFGGSPLAVIFRLALLSILVGVILEVMGLDPWNLIESVRTLFLRIWNMGFDAIRWLWRYLALGAAVVVPIWFIVRLMRAPKGR
ncbi:MAG: hypothetical protein QOC56_1502 [Alphaproteobacteria bacterium]|nr:hypothetical protein [Alphaproteobacteria bacterium]